MPQSNTVLKNVGGSISDLIKQGGDVAGSLSNAQLANYGPGAASDYIKQNGGRTLTISGTPITTGTESAAYTGFTATATGGVGTKVYALVGTWPAAITINTETGAVSGTFGAAVSGVYTGLSVKATDANGNVTQLASFTLTVADA
ncbi:hypothetical protein [Phyllobacterium sophorae]|uniref:Dystroglycan-type cadherin-like domain-containing protein n=1 Tax=Phyllobacterium sophorae TaxID=1520277 RepID=A0A2P7BDW2_9HYPH|nr:hypothetical protein [Phyllobacterium sophorae]PSH64667.1 hypothetical protein CU103_12350 [Phyllobacterium sophorae]